MQKLKPLTLQDLREARIQFDMTGSETGDAAINFLVKGDKHSYTIWYNLDEQTVVMNVALENEEYAYEVITEFIEGLGLKVDSIW
jgi:hypothetical protein